MVECEIFAFALFTRPLGILKLLQIVGIFGFWGWEMLAKVRKEFFTVNRLGNWSFFTKKFWKLELLYPAAMGSFWRKLGLNAWFGVLNWWIQGWNWLRVGFRVLSEELGGFWWWKKTENWSGGRWWIVAAASMRWSGGDGLPWWCWDWWMMMKRNLRKGFGDRKRGAMRNEEGFEHGKRRTRL